MSRSVLVTGGNRGIGRAIAEAFVAQGDQVAVTSRSGDAPDGAFTVPCEVTDTASVDAAFGAVEAHQGPVEVLVANAGITRDTLLLRMSDDDWSQVIDTNLSGSYRVAKRAAKGMLRLRRGRIIFVSSVVGLLGSPGQVNYAASKSGLVGMARSIARELGSRSITANVVAPGFIETDMTAVLPEDQQAAYREQIPLGRMGTTAEVANAVTWLALEQAGHTPVILDDLSSGPREFVSNRIFYQGDVADRALLRRVLGEHPDIDCTIHMAARIVVPESVAQPYLYYRENVAKSLELFAELDALGHPRVLFSSSASLYALPEDGFEVTEDSPLDPPSPYARTKRMMEEILQDMSAATDLRAIILRYFNPIGSDPDLESGIYAKEPSHVLGQLVMAARGQKDSFTITGTDHPTRDGTGIRDYIHVWDLARAHVRAVERFDEVIDAAGAPSVIINVGTGAGVTVRELVTAFQNVFGQEVPVTEAPPRPGQRLEPRAPRREGHVAAPRGRHHALQGQRARPLRHRGVCRPARREA